MFLYLSLYWREVVQVDNLSLQSDRARKFFLERSGLGKFQIGSSALKCSKFGDFPISRKIPFFLRSRIW